MLLVGQLAAKMSLFHFLLIFIGLLLTVVRPTQGLCPNWKNGPPGATTRDSDSTIINYIDYDDLPTVGDDYLIKDAHGKVIFDASRWKDHPVTQAHFQPQAVANRTRDLADVSLTAEERDRAERDDAQCGVPPYVCAVMDDGMRSDAGPTPVAIFADPSAPDRPILMRYYNQYSTHFKGKHGSVVWYPAHGCDEACAVANGGIFFSADNKYLLGEPGNQGYQNCALTFNEIYQTVVIFEQ